MQEHEILRMPPVASVVSKQRQAINMPSGSFKSLPQLLQCLLRDLIFHLVLYRVMRLEALILLAQKFLPFLLQSIVDPRSRWGIRIDSHAMT